MPSGVNNAKREKDQITYMSFYFHNSDQQLLYSKSELQTVHFLLNTNNHISTANTIYSKNVLLMFPKIRQCHFLNYVNVKENKEMFIISKHYGNIRFEYSLNVLK